MMEKFGVKNEDLLNNLRFEERDLKQKIASLRGNGEKIASQELSDSEKKLSQIMEKISEVKASIVIGK